MGGLDSSDASVHLGMRLRERRDEVEAAISLRMAAVPGSSEVRDPLYADGLRVALIAALDYSLAMLASNGSERVDVPAALKAQARLAARSRVGLDTVLRRYFVGYTFIGDVLVQEAERASASGTALQRILRAQAASFDRLLAAVTEEYNSELQFRPSSSEARSTKLVEDLLDGELVDVDELNYDFKLNHLGLIAVSEGGGDAVRTLALELDCRWMMVHQGEAVWAWIGGPEVDPEAVRRLADRTRPEGTAFAVGEVSGGLAGWRLTYEQAKAALRIALREGRSTVRYVDISVVVAALNDDVLVMTLRELFLEPLMEGRDGGGTLLETLKSYFAAQRNLSSASAALEVSRQTVINRLKVVEDRLGLALSNCAVELEIALRINEIK